MYIPSAHVFKYLFLRTQFTTINIGGWIQGDGICYRFSQVALYKQAFNSLNKMKRVMNLKIEIKSFKDISWFVCS